MTFFHFFANVFETNVIGGGVCCIWKLTHYTDLYVCIRVRVEVRVRVRVRVTFRFGVRVRFWSRVRFRVRVRVHPTYICSCVCMFCRVCVDDDRG